ncbi:MAG: 2OG-Fe(II) oxygenase [Chitinophagaceae bacterium]|nr:2OG-Fe(II) oxygenase [Chitinophagaceae bacterium]
MNQQFDQLINSFLSNKVGIAPAFLSQALSTGLRQNIAHLQQSGQMKASGIGNGEKDLQQITRTDKICWLSKTSENVFELEFLEHAEDFIAYLNRTCYAGINASEFHYAVYEKGSYYKRHKDQFKNNNSRKYSLVAYLNENWLAEDGGGLQLYDHENTEPILPHAQSAVLFKSDETEHAVLVANRSRLSISGWLKRV